MQGGEKIKNVRGSHVGDREQERGVCGRAANIMGVPIGSCRTPSSALVCAFGAAAGVAQSARFS